MINLKHIIHISTCPYNFFHDCNVPKKEYTATNNMTEISMPTKNLIITNIHRKYK